MSRVRVRGWWLFSLLALAMMAMPWPAWLVEVVYSRRIYPLVQRAMTGASNQVGWAIIDVLLVAAALYVLWRLVRAFTRARESGIVSGVWELTRRLLRTSALLGLVFLAVWGLNYRRGRHPPDAPGRRWRGRSVVRVGGGTPGRSVSTGAAAARDAGSHHRATQVFRCPHAFFHGGRRHGNGESSGARIDRASRPAAV
jgi:hypothetical protein